MTSPDLPDADRYRDDLALAHRLADVADTVTAARFRALDLHVETKPDLTPVSDADRAVEEEVRRIVGAERPGDGFLGEEYAETHGTSGRRWIVDPVDGTKNFVRGVPFWATLVALQEDGTGPGGTDRVVVGVVSAPAMARRWWAAAGAGAWTTGPGDDDPRRCRVSGVDHLGDAFLSSASFSAWGEHGRGPQFEALLRAVWRHRGFGDFLSHMLVAEGAVDVAPEPELALYDMAAIAVVVEEAGGRFTGVDGGDGPWHGSAVSTNGLLHDAVLALLAAPDAS